MSNHRKATKLARKLDHEEVKRRKKGEKKRSGSFEQASTPFHAVGEMPSQYTAVQSELEKVSRVKRRKEW